MESGLKTLLFEKFEVIDCLKKDDFGAVYIATHIYLNKKIVLKVLNIENLPEESIVERFKREAKLLAGMDNERIIKVLDFGTFQNFFYISFEYFVSNNLRKIFTLNLSVEDKTALTRQLFEGLEYIHANNIIHRDIKPENILVSDKLELKLGDFGLAFNISESYMTSQFSLVGTPAYMAPEQIQGSKVSRQSDLFSAAIVVFELFTGKNPFLGIDINETLNNINFFNEENICNEITGLPKGIEYLLKGLLKKNRDERISSASEILRVLEGDFKKKFTIKKKHIKRTAFAFSFLIITAFLTYFFLQEKPSAVENVPIISNDSTFIPESNKIVLNNEALKTKDEEKVTTDLKELEKKEEKPAENKPVLIEKTEPGRFYVECLPWADLFIDSKHIETTPIKQSIVLDAGVHAVKLVHPNYPVFNSSITIKPGEEASLKINLESLFGYLDCKVSPWSEIFIDGKPAGETPLQKPIKLLPGSHKVTLKSKGFDEAEFNVVISGSQTYTLKHHFK